MSNQYENEKQQSWTPQDARQFLLTELDARQQAIAELSDDQLEAMAGGAGFRAFLKKFVGKCFTCGAQQGNLHAAYSDSFGSLSHGSISSLSFGSSSSESTVHSPARESIVHRAASELPVHSPARELSFHSPR